MAPKRITNKDDVAAKFIKDYIDSMDTAEREAIISQLITKYPGAFRLTEPTATAGASSSRDGMEALNVVARVESAFVKGLTIADMDALARLMGFTVSTMGRKSKATMANIVVMKMAEKLGVQLHFQAPNIMAATPEGVGTAADQPDANDRSLSPRALR
jgi:hypothetical protein